MLLKKMKKKGISPVIATVLLIAMVVVVALIIFIWFRGMIGESAEKFDKNVELVCDDVDFEVEYSSGGVLSVVNKGYVPIFQLQVRVENEGSHDTETIDENTDDWGLGLLEGGAYSGDFNTGINANKIIVFPILLADGRDGRKTYVCGGQYGEEIFI
jgi:flagellin-like protein